MIRAMKEIIFLLLVYAWTETYATKQDWMQCSDVVKGCVCKWVSGRKTATCFRASFTDIPQGFSDEIQSLVLDYTEIRTLKNDAFKQAGLINLQKISMKYCNIHDIEKNAFAGLGIVIEIDLSGNQIRRLDPKLFVATEKLRHVYLNNNSIEKLDDGLFADLKFLQTVEFEENQISHIGYKAFDNIPQLKNVKLNSNQLSHLNKRIFEKFGGSLKSLELKNNPWKCDCHLRDFMVWYTERLYTDPTTCFEPEYLAGSSWKQIQPEQFACKPDVLWPSSDTVFEANSDQLTLSCKVIGDPKPEAYWTFNSRPIGNRTVAGPSLSDRKYMDYHSEESAFWVNVTIHKMNHQDRGIYSCVAKNPAGIIERNVTVSVQSDTPLFGIGLASKNIGDVWVLLLCLFIGIVCALILIFMLCFLCCRRAETIVAKKPPNNSITANGDLTHHIVMEPEQQKTLLTAVNPVQKPPRKYDSSPQSDSGGAEMTELNRNLLDDTSVLGGTSVAGDSIEERRSNNSIEQLSSCNSQDNLLLERLRPLNRSHHPPDLLAFPNRRTQGSPAGSVVSNDPDNSRFRAIHSPVRSPIYQMHQYAPSYETLPYSRTQSPFSPTSMTPVIQHRQGYVTIPRRPRVPSWSSAPTPTMEEALTKAEPVYDNLGPRTTADGSSVLSLTRKVADSSPSNMRSRPLPPAPLYSSHTLPHKSKLNHVYLAIRENEEPQFRPVQNGSGDSRGVIRPLPLQYSPSSETPLPVHDKKRASWATRQVPETGTLKKTNPNQVSPTRNTSTPIPTVTAANGSVSGGTPSSKSQKVPPKPPPKPKKNGPLFEDEGEDGTEV
ncbi:uncharacterized protein kek5 [Planococcus citri]|uniref:uncharacterized protein kek5 n=1 Tax=Planococcus citri TaxID=170843 RepID=UPI0031F8D7C2